ncbi:MAG: prepilin-type N-terminal cleavage/methylation domain-containing protein [Candidatus Marinimicrobia bacterium]|nr:prepilin-type N-terminal cleavage/methylation domain-containing protein [Candidatus Neomarinimicrobiota bacterium]
MKQNLRTRESGFTLIEVLVVVIIVAILAAVAFPIYQNYVKGAYASDAQSAIGSIYNAAQMYYQDMGEWPSDVIEDLEPKYINIKEATKLQWEFEMIGGGDDLTQITANSTDEMKQGAGNEVIYTVATGRFSGYGFDEEK